MVFLKKIIDLYLYSSIHIALGAMLSVILCYAVFIHIPNSDYPLFVFSATLFLYCIHRIVGINKVRSFENEGRFAIIKKFRTHLFFYAILGAVAMVYFYYGLPKALQLWLLIPGVISLLYVLPLFSNNRRLRDYNFIKIFLISAIWGLIISLIPYYEAHQTVDFKGILYFLEKTIFIFAITIPFDIRDLKVDKEINVSTIPHKIGIKNAYKLSYFLLAVAILLVALQFATGSYSLALLMGISAGYLLAMGSIKISENKTNDYFYSGLIDGTIGLVAIIGIVLSGILGVLF